MRELESNTHRVSAWTDLVKTSSGGQHLVVEAPWPPLRVSRPLTHGDIHHPLLRPYEQVTKHGNPTVGSVQYYLTHFPVDPCPRVHFAVAFRPKGPSDPNLLLPGPIHIFPGFRPDLVHARRGERFDIHHVSVRELPNRKIRVYTKVFPFHESEPRRVGRKETVEDAAPVMQIGHMWVRNPRALAQAGYASTRLTDGAVRSLSDRGSLFDDPLPTEHWLTFVPPNADLRSRPHHHWAGFFLSETDLGIEETATLAQFVQLVTDLVPSEPIAYDPAFDGTVTVQSTATDLSAFGDPGGYRYLVVLRATLEGQMKQESTFVALPQSIPPEALDML